MLLMICYLLLKRKMIKVKSSIKEFILMELALFKLKKIISTIEILCMFVVLLNRFIYNFKLQLIMIIFKNKSTK